MAKEYSAIERARNAAKQARDRTGKFIEMNGTMRYKSGGKTKTGTIIGISGGYAYFLPPIKNATHRPQPYRIPLNALEMFKPKATLRDKKKLAEDRKIIREQTKLFESKLDPNRKKEQDDHNRIVKQAKKEKLDIDKYEVDDEGVEHFYKDEDHKADPKLQGQINAVINSLSEKDSFRVPLEDGFNMEIQRINGKITTKVLDSEGKTHSSKEFSEKKTNNEISQEIAKDVARENDTRDVGEEVQIEIDPEDIDGDGIPDISDPRVSPDIEDTTNPSKPTKEELDVAPKGTVIVSEDENVIYSKTARRSESNGQQWNRYLKKDGGYVLDREDMYSKDIADGTTFKRVNQKAPEERAKKDEEKRAKRKELSEKDQRRADINSAEKNIKGPEKVRGVLPVDEKLLNLLPESTIRDPKTPDNVSFPREDFSAEKLDSLPVGTQVSVTQRNGSISRVTKMADGTWFSKKRYKDNLSGMDQHVLSSEEVYNDAGDDIKVRASTEYRRKKDREDSEYHSGVQRRAYESGRTKSKQAKFEEAEERERKEIFDEALKPTTVGEKESAEEILKSLTASKDDLPYTEYRLTKDSGEEGLTYRKMPNGKIVNTNVEEYPQDIFDNADDFAEVFKHRGNLRMYDIIEDNAEEPAPKPSDMIETLGYDETTIPKPTTPKKLTPPKNENKVKSGYHTYSSTNPIESITGIDGEEYELGDSRTKRMARIGELFRKGLIDVDKLVAGDYKAMFEAEEGEETGRVYNDGTPIRVGDEILYRTGLHENSVNAKDDYLEVRSIVIGRMNGKDDLLILPVEEVTGKTRETRTGATVTRTFGPENALTKTNGVTNANLNKIRRTTDDGYELVGDRNPTNVDGRTGNFDLHDLYSQDGSVLGREDRVKFRMQNRQYNDEGIPYNNVHEGTIVSVNAKNQSFVVLGDDGKLYRPSVKNTTSGDGPDPIPEPRIQDELDVPEGMRLDSQNRLLTEESAQVSEEVRDSLDQNRQTGTSPDSSSSEGSAGNSVDEMKEQYGEVTDSDKYDPTKPKTEEIGESKKDSEIFGEPSETKEKVKPEPRKKRNLINSVVNTEQEYDSSIPRYFRDRKDNEYGSDAEKATDWANAPVGSTIRLMGGGFAIKTTVDSWDFRKSSKHLVQRRLSNKKFAETLVANPDFLEKARTTAPSRKKFLEYNGGKLSPTAKPSARKAPTGSEVEVEGDKLTKTDTGWKGDQGELLSDKQLDKIMVENPDDVKVTKVSVSKVVSDTKSVAIQDSIFDLNDDGSFSRNDVFSFSPKETISAEEVDTVAGGMSPDFNMVVKDKNNNSEDSWDAVEVISLDSDGNIVFSLDDNAEQTAKQVMSDFSSRLEGSAVPPRRIIIDESEHFQTVSAYSKPNPDGGYDLVVNPDGVEEKDIASALADGIRQNNATARGMSLRDYDTQVLHSVVSEEDRSLSYDEILKKLGIRSKRKGSVVAEAFADVWENGPDASPIHLNIWKKYASDNEMIALFRKDNGRDPVSDSELDKYRKKL